MEPQTDVRTDPGTGKPSTISGAMARSIEASSWIRQMFEDGAALKRTLGEDNVFDFTLGNPNVPPPEAFHEKLVQVAQQSRPADHRYMTNLGLEETRRHIAEQIRRDKGVPVTGDHVVMTCGAAGALNVLMKSTLDVGDEVIVFSPYFPEYLFYIENHGGRVVIVPTGEGFLPDADALRGALNARTRAVIINTPNNPTGAVYPQSLVDELAAVVDEHSAVVGRPVYLVLDEPYRRIRYTDVEHPSVLEATRHGVVLGSWSKDLGLAGERIGYLAVHPDLPGVETLISGISIATRVLGFVNAPAFMQRLVRECDDLYVDAEIYRRNRDTLYAGLTAAGYRMAEPSGAFFMFPEVPGGDDVAFCRHLRDYNVLCVPGIGFGTPGYMRISYAVPHDVLERALPRFRQAIGEYSG